MEFVPLAAALALAWKLIDFAKFLTTSDWKAAITQGATWASGVLVIFLLAATDFAGGIEIGSLPLAELNAASLILVGFSLGSGGSVLYDFKRAFDNTDSARTTMHHGSEENPTHVYTYPPATSRTSGVNQ